MDGEAPATPGGQKVANQRAGWKMQVALILCLLQAANALKGPRLVSGEPGGAVTIQCRYTPTSINRHQRKYWCRLSPLTWLCHTVVSTNHYTHGRYSGRVALADFPHRGLFVVRLTQLSPEDGGSYRCGIGNGNDMLFLSMNLAVSAGMGSPSPSPRATSAASELVRRSFRTASPAANRWAPGTTQTRERQGTEWGRAALTPETSKRTASAKGMQTPGTPGLVAAGTVSQVESSSWATIPIPESPASAVGGMPDTAERNWLWGTRSSATNRAGAREEGRETTMEANRPREEAERVRIVLATDWTVIKTTGPSTLASEKQVWETRQEPSLVSTPQALGSIEGTTGAAGVWAWGPTSTEMSSAEGSTEGDLDMPAGGSGPQTAPSQDLVAGPLRPPGRGSSKKSSGDRKGPRSHLDSDDIFAGAEPPARSAAPCGAEDTPRGFFSCLCHHEGPREGPWTLRNERITRTKHHDPFSSFLHLYTRK
ncbi:high affinity immunoglobulin alpha and immunoglobulin mu Fc receptor isoform X3 [Myotis yumanensis]|uniref:high affinity immunoglobulin alpha and immunoglobulin mu Fc receptor isoform X3 n=1 Tax=Myotis yumanensis TaxID=159337 RepID=UPI0038D4E0C6